MFRSIVFAIFLCFLAFESSLCLPKKASSHQDVTEAAPGPPPQFNISTEGPKTTTKSPDPTDPPTPITTSKATTTSTTTSTTTTSAPPSSTTPSSTTSSTPVPPTVTTTSSTTHAPNVTTSSPTTTDHPHPQPPPSDRKFDAMSFLGGFALGLGLVAIGILSWKFYLSRQENYYHTL